MYLCVDMFASAVAVASDQCWDAWLLGLPVNAGLSCGSVENNQAKNVAYDIASPLASIREDLYSFTCCPDSSVSRDRFPVGALSLIHARARINDVAV